MKYEAHITVEPTDDVGGALGVVAYEAFVLRSKELGWKASKFEHDDNDGIAGKWFMSFGSDNRDAIMAEVQGMAHGLAMSGFTVLRCKLEETLFDTKDGDKLDEMVATIVTRDLEKMA